jgi:crotonobetainyl-CoA:carnitine CoA-transferase CaiB-like acyl-CoA transferase
MKAAFVLASPRRLVNRMVALCDLAGPRTAQMAHPHGADVFMHNLAPGAVTRLGFGSAALRRAHPRLITCEISGYGSSGPYRDKKAYDLLVQSEAGLVSITGTPETPSKVGISIADISAGMYAFSGILAALLRRERTGEGMAVEVSLFDSLAEWMGYPAYFAGYGGSAPPRTGARHAAIAPYGPYTAGDGKAVYLGIQNDREWTRFLCEGARSACAGRRAALYLELLAGGAPGGARRDRHRGVLTLHGGAGRRAARRGGHCQRADEHRERISRSPATRRAELMATGRLARRSAAHGGAAVHPR